MGERSGSTPASTLLRSEHLSRVHAPASRSAVRELLSMRRSIVPLRRVAAVATDRTPQQVTYHGVRQRVTLRRGESPV
jgi:hypothetical protein